MMSIAHHINPPDEDRTMFSHRIYAEEMADIFGPDWRERIANGERLTLWADDDADEAVDGDE